MGIGDTVMFLPFIKSISTKFNSPVSLLVKESSRADQFLEHTKYIDKIIHLKRNNQNKATIMEPQHNNLPHTIAPQK